MRVAAHSAWVETYGGDRRLGWTVVRWTGTLDTLWPEGVGLAQAERHWRALDLALASRGAMLRMLALATSRAVTLVTALATLRGPLLALPAAWRFLDGMLAEVSRHEAAS